VVDDRKMCNSEFDEKQGVFVEREIDGDVDTYGNGLPLLFRGKKQTMIL